MKLKSKLLFNFMYQFHVYSDIEGLYKYIPRDSLPSDYGGKEKSLDALQSKYLFIYLIT